MNYINLDGDKIIGVFFANDGRDGITISKTKLNKIKWLDGKIYKWINNDVVEEDDPNYLDQRKKEERAKVNAQTQKEILEGFEHPNGSGDMIEVDMFDIIDYLALQLKKGRVNNFKVSLTNGEYKPYTGADIDSMTDAAFDHVMSKKQAGRTKKEQINACTTLQELDNLIATF